MTRTPKKQMTNLQINLNDPDSLPLAKQIETHAKLIFDQLNIENAQVSMTFLKPKEIAQLNQQYRNKTEPTDVLTFALDDPELFGDIYICLAEVRRKAADYNLNPNTFLDRVLAHSAAHLMKYDHQSDDQERKMIEYENKLLKQL